MAWSLNLPFAIWLFAFWSPFVTNEASACARNRGPHKSAQEHAAFVREEMADFCQQGFWVVLPLDEVIDMKLLRLSPLGVVPQRNRRPRLINDLSFSEVNADTVKTGPAEAMQFGRALTRILYQVRHANPEFGPVYASKLDVADGFYRLGVNARQALRLACLLPRDQQEPQLVAIPLALPMGWVESPPYFCAATETVADLANSRLNLRQVPRHRLEDAALHPTAPVDSANRISSTHARKRCFTGPSFCSDRSLFGATVSSETGRTTRGNHPDQNRCRTDCYIAKPIPDLAIQAHA
jgi:hypothetical protein